jgi:hypothetical protein
VVRVTTPKSSIAHLFGQAVPAADPLAAFDSVETFSFDLDDDMVKTIALARLIFGGAMNLQAPPNLMPEGYELYLEAGLNDGGGVSPLTPDFINPEAPWPALQRLEEKSAEAGFSSSALAGVSGVHRSGRQVPVFVHAFPLNACATPTVMKPAGRCALPTLQLNTPFLKLLIVSRSYRRHGSVSSSRSRRGNGPCAAHIYL